MQRRLGLRRGLVKKQVFLKRLRCSSVSDSAWPPMIRLTICHIMQNRPRGVSE